MERRAKRPARTLECVAAAVEIDGKIFILIRFRNWIVVARPGDLVVCYRRSNFQKVSNINGDPCTHIAILAVIDGQVAMIEMGASGVFSRDYHAFASAYEWIGVIHLDVTDAERDTLLTNARNRLDSGYMRYSLVQCAHIAGFGLVRRGLPAIFSPALRAIALASAGIAYRRSGPDSATCSGFIAQVLDEALQGERSGTWPTRRRVTPWRRAPDVMAITTADRTPRHPLPRGVLHVLTSPTDVFVTAPCHHRTIIGPDDITVLPGVARERSLVNCSVNRPSRRRNTQPR